MDLLTIYLVLILPNFGAALAVIGGAGAAIGVGFSLSSLINGDCTYGDPEKKKAYFSTGKKTFKITGMICAPLILMAILIPSNKQMMYMIGGYAATNVEGVEKLPKNIADAANKFLEQYTDVKGVKK